jgi:Icc-related predicted phosphoesterase
MRLHILSDLHLEFASFTPSAVDADVVILAGDVHVGHAGLKWIRETYRDKPVLYVLGNHDFYGQTIPTLTRQLEEIAAKTNVHVLENNSVRIGEVLFLGATLWTDFLLNGTQYLSEITAQVGMVDYERIRTAPKEQLLTPSNTRRLHEASLRWLGEQVASHRGEKVVVITHHAPSAKSISERYQGDALNPAFASALDDFVAQCGAKLWIHGHIHWCSDYLIGNTRVLANPRGYPHEQSHNFDPKLVVQV